MGKTIQDIKFIDKHKPIIHRSEYIQTKGKLFELWRIDGDKSNTLYVITIDKKYIITHFVLYSLPHHQHFVL
jgi:muconolactone delta-isomerase